MRSGLIALAVVLLPAFSMAQPHASYDGARPAGPDQPCQAVDCTGWKRRSPSQICQGGCAQRPDRDNAGGAWLGPAHDRRGYQQGYYRDYYPAPQYGYTYGSAHGRGYGYSYGDYSGPTPYPGDW